MVSGSKEEGKMANEERCRSTRAKIEENMNKQVTMNMWVAYEGMKKGINNPGDHIVKFKRKININTSGKRQKN